MTRHGDEPCEVPKETRSIKITLIEKADDLREQAERIEKMTHELVVGLTGEDPIDEKRNEKDSEKAKDLMNILMDLQTTTDRANYETIRRLEYLVKEFC
jgi:hypothetical protein